MKVFCAAILAFTLLARIDAADQPNIIWITAEDMSPALGCYGDQYAHTPHIDSLARESVRFTNAFATSPVCSPVRSTLITGCYAPTLGTHNMRSGFPLPRDVHGFPGILRKAGYYTSNNVKTDYNTADANRLMSESWDESSNTAHWRNRPDPSQPFFSVFNLMTSHQSRSMVWPYEKFAAEIQSRLPAEIIHKPESAIVPPYYPDTPLVRREWARFYDCVSAMDQQVGDLLKQLREDGLHDDTIVFFFSDHGSGMPRHKRALLDTGMHVPLLIHTPGKWKRYAVGTAGESDDRLLSFVDFPPTVLDMATIPIPDYMQGFSFAAAKGSASRRKYVFGHRDRVDEAFDCARSVRSSRYLYIRNLMPHLSYHQPSAWPDQGTIRAEISTAALNGNPTPAQQHYIAANRPTVELYDCQNDPLNLHNLASDPRFRTIRTELSQALVEHLQVHGDLGFIPEAQLASMVSASDSFRDRRKKAVTLCNQQRELFATPDSSTTTISFRTDKKFQQNYWWAISLNDTTWTHEKAAELESQLDTTPASAAGIEAASALLNERSSPAALKYLINCTEAENLHHVLRATRAIELLRRRGANFDEHSATVKAIENVAARCQQILPTATTATFVQTPEQDTAMFISFSANAFLKNLKSAN